jgi:cytochrome P450
VASTDRGEVSQRGGFSMQGREMSVGRARGAGVRWRGDVDREALMVERDENYGVGLAELMNPEVARTPQPILSLLPASSPVFRLDGVGVIVTTRAAVDRVLREPEVFSSSSSAHDLKAPRPLIPLQVDPPDHRKYRRALDPIFAPGRMRALESEIRDVVNELIDGFVDEAEIDFAARFSTPFPSRVFLSMFGLPIEDLPTFLAMKDGMIRPDHVVGKPLGHPDTETQQQETADSIYAYFERVIAERGARRDDNLLSQFLDVEIDGDRLSHEEVLDICFALLIAGLDTVTASLDCMFVHLAEHPDERQALTNPPHAVESVVEELLRWETPVMGGARIATRDTEIDGFAVSAGEPVMVLYAAANLDESEFTDADRIDLNRNRNRHLAFGGGIHRCMGSHLARIELRTALAEWHRRLPDYAIAPGAELTFTPGIRALDAFPMRLVQSERRRKGAT